MPSRSTYHPTSDHPLKPCRAALAHTALEAYSAYRVIRNKEDRQAKAKQAKPRHNPKLGLSADIIVQHYRS